MKIELPRGYKPRPDEKYMCDRQVEYFRRKLTAWRNELLEEYDDTRREMESGGSTGADFADQASRETDMGLELRTRDRERRLLAKIDQALERIKDGTYGFCSETGQPIGIKRLEARPVATLCIEAQERHEERERKGYAD
jgi:DnaK suppressor protein